MTLYFSDVDDGRGVSTEERREIIGSNADEYARIIDDGELVIDVEPSHSEGSATPVSETETGDVDLMHEDKQRTLLQVAHSVIEPSDAYELVNSATVEYVPEGER